MTQQFIPNVIVFGETGVGKSSIVNMILGSDKAKVGNGLLGETFRSTTYPVEIGGKDYSLHDTVGLGEYSGGTVDSAKAIRNLSRLVTDLSNSGGVNLLVFVMKRGRLTETIHKNYTLFYRGFCDSKVPIVIVVTGCEDVEPTMDAWWVMNERWFTQAGMSFNGYACVCAFRGTQGSGYRNNDLVTESVEVVKQLVVQNCMPNGWEKPPGSWLRQAIGSIIYLFQSSRISPIYTDLYNRLSNDSSNPGVEEIIHSVIRSNRSPPNVVLFGGTGVRESNIINTILGSDKTRGSYGHNGSAQPVRSTGKIHGETYNLYDTVELEEHRGNNGFSATAAGLYHLVSDLSNDGGIHLLVFVINCGGPTEVMRKQYDCLHHSFCDSKVPIVIIVTGCDDVRPTMDAWWRDNESLFTTAKMSFDGHACVRGGAFEGKYGGSNNQDLESESVELLRRLIVEHCMPNGWKKKKQSIDLAEPSTVHLFCWPNKSDVRVHNSLYERLRITFPDPEAKSIIEAIGKTGKRARNS